MTKGFIIFTEICLDFFGNASKQYKNNYDKVINFIVDLQLQNKYITEMNQALQMSFTGFFAIEKYFSYVQNIYYQFM